MKKLYAFLLALATLVVLSSGALQAQTYAITDYQVRTASGSGSSYQPITGTHVTEVETNPNGHEYYFEWASNAIAVPFNFRFLNQQFTTSNNLYLDGTGDVILDPSITWSGHSTYQYIFDNYYVECYIYDKTNGYGYDY